MLLVGNFQKNAIVLSISVRGVSFWSVGILDTKRESALNPRNEIDLEEGSIL